MSSIDERIANFRPIFGDQVSLDICKRIGELNKLSNKKETADVRKHIDDADDRLNYLFQKYDENNNQRETPDSSVVG